MANVVREGGLTLVDAVGGSGQGMEICVVPSSDTNNMGAGDPVNQTAANYTSIGSGENVPQVVQGTATGVVYGVMMSNLPHYSDGNANMDLTKVYRPASTKQYVLVRVANTQDIYEITDDGVTPGLTSGHLNYNYKFITSGCDTTTGMSKFQIDSANGANTATYPMKVIMPSTRPDNDPTAANASWRVTLNNVTRAGGTGTAGV